jgi:hypothetical protein
MNPFKNVKSTVILLLIGGGLYAIYGIGQMIGFNAGSEMAKDLFDRVNTQYQQERLVSKTPTIAVVTPSQTILVSDSLLVTPTAK